MPQQDDTSRGTLLVGCMPALAAFVRRRVVDRETTNEILRQVSLRALVGDGPEDPGSFWGGAAVLLAM